MGKTGRGQPTGWLEFWPWFWERGGLGVDVPGRLLWNVHKMSRMKKKIPGSGTLARSYHRDLDEDSRCRQEAARGDWHPVRPSAWGRECRWSDTGPAGGNAHVRVTVWTHTISKDNHA